jgi:ribosomal peptide maturation radical SAM protein 1
MLTGRMWYPFSEWVFSRPVHDGRMDFQEPATRRLLRKRSEFARNAPLGGEDLLRLRDSVELILQQMVDQLSSYDVIGIGSSFFQNLPALALARRVKERWPGKTVVLGGANTDGEMGATLLAQFSFLDYVFSGEVDHHFPEFIGRLSRGDSLAGLPGLLQRQDDSNAPVGSVAPPLEDLNALPIPDFDDYIQERKRLGIDRFQPLTLALESSRGCWWGERQHCTFCGLNATGMQHRQKRFDRMRTEIMEVCAKYNPRFFFMADNILPFGYYSDFMQWAKDYQPGVGFFYEIKSNVKRSQVSAMADAGITAVQPGIESFNTDTLNLMRKGVSAIQNIAFLRYAQEYGVLPVYNVLVGFPGESREANERTARELPKLAHLRPPVAMAEIEYHRFSPYHADPESFGLRLRPSNHYSHLYPFSSDVLTRIAYVFEDENKSPDYRKDIRAIYDRIVAWANAFAGGNCMLSWSARGDEIRISDQRPGFGPARFILGNYAARLFEFLDEPHSLKGLLRHAGAQRDLMRSGGMPTSIEERESVLTIDFDADTFLKEPHACLALLVDRALVFADGPFVSPSAGIASNSLLPPVLTEIGTAAEGQYYLALPISEICRKPPKEWSEIGV